MQVLVLNSCASFAEKRLSFVEVSQTNGRFVKLRMHNSSVIVDKGSNNIRDDLCGRNVLKILSNGIEVHQTKTFLIVSTVERSECFIEPSN